MDLILSRAPTRPQSTREHERRQAAEDALRVATEDLVRATRGMERIIRQVHLDPNERPWGLSQRQIAEMSGLARTRVKSILDTTEGDAPLLNSIEG